MERLTEKVPRRGGRPEPRILLRPFHKRSAAKPASLSAELHWQEKMEPRHGKRQGDSETRRQEGQGRGETVPACKMRGDHAGPPPQDAPDLCPRFAGRGRRGQGAAPGLVPLGPGLALKAGPPTSLPGGAPHHVPLGQPGAPARGGRRRWPAGLDLEAPQTLPPDGKYKHVMERRACEIVCTDQKRRRIGQCNCSNTPHCLPISREAPITWLCALETQKAMSV